MGWLNSEKVPEKLSAPYFKMFVERLRTALNYLDSSNFPNGLSGTLLSDRSVALNSKITGYGGLVLYEDFFTLMQSTTIAATSLTTYGSAVQFTPAITNLARVYLEVTCSAANASYPCTVVVAGPEGAILTESITDTTFSRREFEITELPDTTCTLIFRAQVNNATYPLTVLSARLILKLTESIT